MDHLIKRPAPGAEVGLARPGVVTDGDGAYRLVVGGDREGSAELADGFRRDAEVAGAEALR
jgi:hypothetical protein